jgi:hypothetical protein
MPRHNPDSLGTVLVDETDPTNIYVGKSATGALTSSAVWRIQLISIVGPLVVIKFANGSPEFNSIWDNRTFLTYS